MPAITNAVDNKSAEASTSRKVGGHFILSPLEIPLRHRSWFVGSVGIRGWSGIGGLIRIDIGEAGVFQLRVVCRKILLPDFRPAGSALLEISFEFPLRARPLLCWTAFLP